MKIASADPGDSAPAKNPGIAVAYAVVFIAAFWLLFYHLDNHLLWGDEAETGVLAKHVLQFGVPRTYDGTNYILLHGPIDETPGHVWTWSPWLQEYVAATSFLFFGATTWAARAPFALAGGCSLILLALVAFKVYRKHSITLAAVVLLGTSEIFVLHARQCRYYAISVFGEILLVYGLYEWFRGNRRSTGWIALALVLQFYSNYIMVAANLPAIAVAAWMLRRNKTALRQLVAALGIFAVLATPWLAYARPWRQGGVVGHEHYFLKACGYLSEFHFHFMPLCILLLPLLGLAAARRAKRPVEAVPSPLKQWEIFLSLLVPSYLAVIVVTPGFYLRYLLPVLPIACLLAAVWVFRYVRWPWLAAALVIAQSTTNIFPIVSAYPAKGVHQVRSPLVDYVRGMSSSYTDRVGDVLHFFETQAQPGDRVLSFDPELPLIFYTPLGIIDARLVAPAKDQLPAWILPESASAVADQPPVALPDFLSGYYEPITIRVHHSIRGGSVPDPDSYQYRTASNTTPFVIYRHKSENKN